MKIIYKKGNLLEAPERCLLQGTNCQGVMGSGVAKAIREKYPEVYPPYRKKFEEEGLRLGETIWVMCHDGKIVVNCNTQEFYGKDGRRYVDYDAVRKVMKNVNANFALNQTVESYRDLMGEYGDSVALPKLGAGLGGGSWEIIEAIIEEELVVVQPVVYEI